MTDVRLFRGNEIKFSRDEFSSGIETGKISESSDFRAADA